MNDTDDLTRILRAAADRAGPVAPPDPTRLAARARRRQGGRRLTAAVAAVAVAVAGTVVVVARLHDRSASRRVTTIGPSPAGDGTAAELAEYHWSDLPTPPIQTRGEAAVAWTGKELVVWGGATLDAKALGDGAAFDPARSRWRTIAAPPAALPLRTGASAVWTGTEVLVLGGSRRDNQAIPAGVGGAYDPATDRWRLLPAGPAGNDLVLSATWTGTEAVVVTRQRSTAAYDPAADRWRALPALPETDHTVQWLVTVWTGTRLLVWALWADTIDLGGGTVSLPSGIDLYSLDPATGTWTAVPRPAVAPLGISAAFWTGHEVVLPAAQDYRGAASGPPTMGRTGFRYDPATGTYLPIAAGPVDDGFGSAVWTGSALLVVNPSIQTGGGRDLAPGDGAAWDPVRDAWTRVPGAPPSSTYGASQFVWTGAALLSYGPRPARFGP